jgi:hypothetical protein
MLATRPTLRAPARAPPPSSRARRAPRVAARAGGLDTNIFVNLVASSVCAVVPAAVAVLTSEDTDAEVKRLQTVEGAAPFAAAVAADAVAHSIPGERKGGRGWRDVTRKRGLERGGERGRRGGRGRPPCASPRRRQGRVGRRGGGWAGSLAPFPSGRLISMARPH